MRWIRDLITHQSGLPHYEDIPAYAARQDGPGPRRTVRSRDRRAPARGTRHGLPLQFDGLPGGGMVLGAATGQPDGAVGRSGAGPVAPGIGLPAQGSTLAVGHDDGPIGDSANADRGGAAQRWPPAPRTSTPSSPRCRTGASCPTRLEPVLTPHADRGVGLVYGWASTSGPRRTDTGAGPRVRSGMAPPAGRRRPAPCWPQCLRAQFHVRRGRCMASSRTSACSTDGRKPGAGPIPF